MSPPFNHSCAPLTLRVAESESRSRRKRHQHSWSRKFRSALCGNCGYPLQSSHLVLTRSGRLANRLQLALRCHGPVAQLAVSSAFATAVQLSTSCARSVSRCQCQIQRFLFGRGPPNIWFLLPLESVGLTERHELVPGSLCATRVQTERDKASRIHAVIRTRRHRR